jgi:hypothetical protein
MNIKLILTVTLISAIPLVSSGSTVVQADTKDSHNSSLMAQSNVVTEPNPALMNSVKNADYIFQGVVTQVDYRLSNGSPQLPYTFVTFKIEQLLKGQVNQQFVTLRFIGGPNENTKKFLTVSGVPLFDVGERSILFVKDNGQSDCPLVGCQQGRLRIANNQVYTEDGVQILLNNQGKLVYGSLAPLQEARTHKIGETIVTNVFSNPEVGNDSDGFSTGTGIESQNSIASLPALNSTQLAQIIQKQLSQLATLGQLQTRAFVTSVDIRQPFSAPSGTPVAPPQVATPPAAPARVMSEADRRELEMLRQNGGNPVFINSKPQR